jgi:hypothetical protein
MLDHPDRPPSLPPASANPVPPLLDRQLTFLASVSNQFVAFHISNQILCINIRHLPCSSTNMSNANMADDKMTIRIQKPRYFDAHAPKSRPAIPPSMTCLHAGTARHRLFCHSSRHNCPRRPLRRTVASNTSDKLGRCRRCNIRTTNHRRLLWLAALNPIISTHPSTIY